MTSYDGLVWMNRDDYPSELYVDLPPTCTIPTAARILGLSDRYTRELVATGRLPSLKVGRRRIIARHHIVEFLSARKARR